MAGTSVILSLSKDQFNCLFPLVPKLHLGTLLPSAGLFLAKFHFALV